MELNPIKKMMVGLEYIKCKACRDADHFCNNQDKGNRQVYRVHDARTGIHAYQTNILRDAVHEVTGSVLFIETLVEGLVFIVDFIFEVVFYEPRHDDNRLAH